MLNPTIKMFRNFTLKEIKEYFPLVLYGYALFIIGGMLIFLNKGTVFIAIIGYLMAEFSSHFGKNVKLLEERVKQNNENMK